MRSSCHIARPTGKREACHPRGLPLQRLAFHVFSNEGDRREPVHVHVSRAGAETGQRAIYVNAAFTQHVVGVSEARSRELLEHLYAQAAIPEYQCRFRWEANSIAFWDNRSSQHYAASDYWPAVRPMERVTVVGRGRFRNRASEEDAMTARGVYAAFLRPSARARSLSAM
jgi:alpha-ketoglutarate-dependent taurine dioxygenase